MRDHRWEFSVERMAKVLEVSKSGFYAWLLRPESARKRARRLLDARVRAAFEAHKARYGSTKIARYLTGQGHPCSRTRVAQSMRRQGLRSKVARKFRATTDSNHHLAAAPNLLDRNFDIDAPNRVWASDITYLPSKAGLVVSGGLHRPVSRGASSVVREHQPAARDGPQGALACYPCPASAKGADDPLRPRHPILLRGVPGKDRRIWVRPEHEPKGELLGQRSVRVPFPVPQDRVGLPHRPGRPRARRARTLRIHRGLLQQPAVARVFGLRISSRLRTPKSGLVHRPLFKATSTHPWIPSKEGTPYSHRMTKQGHQFPLLGGVPRRACPCTIKAGGGVGLRTTIDGLNHASGGLLFLSRHKKRPTATATLGHSAAVPLHSKISPQGRGVPRPRTKEGRRSNAAGARAAAPHPQWKGQWRQSGRDSCPA